MQTIRDYLHEHPGFLHRNSREPRPDNIDASRRNIVKLIVAASAGVAAIYYGKYHLLKPTETDPNDTNSVESTGQITVKYIDGLFYAQNSGMTFKFVESEPAKAGDGIGRIIQREWLKYSKDPEVVPVDTEKLGSDQSTINLLTGAERTYARVRKYLQSKDIKVGNTSLTFNFDRNEIPPIPMVNEGKSYPVPIPLKLGSLDEALRH